jgi:hypothetical protein
MRGNQSSLKHQAHPESIDAHVIADGVKPLEAFTDRCSYQILGNATKPEAAKHDHRADSQIRNHSIRELITLFTFLPSVGLSKTDRCPIVITSQDGNELRACRKMHCGNSNECSADWHRSAPNRNWMK